MIWYHAMLATLVAAVWGANFVAAKVGLAHFPPLFLTSLRFFFVAALLWPWMLRTRPVRGMFSLSFVMGVLHFGMVYAGLARGLDVASSVIASQMSVPFSCLLGVIFYRDRIGLWRSLGITIAFTGMIFVAGTPHVAAHFLAFVLTMAGAFCFAWGNIQMKRLGQVGMLELVGWTSLYAAPQLLLLSWLFEDGQWTQATQITWPVAFSLVYMVVFASVLGHGAWYALLQRYPISIVAPFSLLSPFFAIGSAALFLGESLNGQTLLGGMATMLGVGIIVMRKPAFRDISADT